MKNKIHRMSIAVLALFLLLLPIDAALGNLIGKISLINYIGFIYIFLRIFQIVLIDKKFSIVSFKKNIFLLIYIIYFVVSMLFRQNDQFNLFFYESFLLSAFIAILAIADTYEKKDFILFEKSIAFSFCSVLFAYLFMATTENGRLVFNSTRTMDPNFFASGMCLMVGVLFNNILTKNKKILWIIMLVFALFIIMLTGSRSGLVANLVVIFFIFLFNSNVSRGKKISFIIMMLFVILFLSTNITKYIPQDILARFSLNYMINDSGAGRFIIWKRAIEFFYNNNILRMFIGTGPGTFQYLVMNGGHAAHNIYIQTLVEGGFLNFVIFMLFVIKTCINNLKNKNYLMFSVFIGCCISGLGIDINITRFFWICVFLCMSNYNISHISKKGGVDNNEKIEGKN